MYASDLGARPCSCSLLSAPCLDTWSLASSALLLIYITVCTYARHALYHAGAPAPAQMYLCEVVLLSVGALALKAVREVVVALPSR